MKSLILHSEIARDAGKDEEDVLLQARCVADALSDLGHDPVSAPFVMDVRSLRSLLEAHRPALVFNLVETVEGSGRLIHTAPAMLDHLGAAYTGSGTDAVFMTSNKLVAKRLMAGSDVPTPAWITPLEAKERDRSLDAPYIVKSVWEHASIGLDEGSVVFPQDTAALLLEMEKRRKGLGGDCFVELYIDGREFNLSLLAGHNGPEVLPPAEIVFDRFPEEKLKLVDYRAKWEPSSFEYRHTPRAFEFTGTDLPLISRLKDIAVRCWHLFGLRGYARVDFRVDVHGKPWVLEVNTNPCLSPDAGFAAAAERAGLALKRVVERIIRDSAAPSR